MTKPVFSLKDVIVTVGDSIQILKSINFDIYDGDFITVLGTN
ncbi:MAG: ABC transporter ATP-binding protein, partial [Leuconostoc mesenteroides]